MPTKKVELTEYHAANLHDSILIYKQQLIKLLEHETGKSLSEATKKEIHNSLRNSMMDGWGSASAMLQNSQRSVSSILIDKQFDKPSK